MVEVMKIMVTSFKRSHACTANLSVPSPAAGHHQLTPTSAGDVWTLIGKAGSVSHGVLSPGSCYTRFCLCPERDFLPVLCKLSQLIGGVNCNLLQEGLCHTQVCCTQSPRPCGSSLLTRTSTGETQTQFCLSL